MYLLNILFIKAEFNDQRNINHSVVLFIDKKLRKVKN